MTTTTTATDTLAAGATSSAWRGFRGMLWQRDIDVRAFIQSNFDPYEGDGAFLAPATPRTLGIWETLNTLFVEERKKGVLDVSQTPSSILLDIKAWDPAQHVKYVGMEIGPTRAFARRLAALRRPMWIRHVVVPGWTDDEATRRGIAEFAAGLGNVERVDVLPFHQMGRYKWSQLHMTYRLEHVEPPSDEAVQRSADAFRAVGLRAY